MSLVLQNVKTAEKSRNIADHISEANWGRSHITMDKKFGRKELEYNGVFFQIIRAILKSNVNNIDEVRYL